MNSNMNFNITNTASKDTNNYMYEYANMGDVPAGVEYTMDPNWHSMGTSIYTPDMTTGSEFSTSVNSPVAYEFSRGFAIDGDFNTNGHIYTMNPNVVGSSPFSNGIGPNQLCYLNQPMTSVVNQFMRPSMPFDNQGYINYNTNNINAGVMEHAQYTPPMVFTTGSNADLTLSSSPDYAAITPQFSQAAAVAPSNDAAVVTDSASDFEEIHNLCMDTTMETISTQDSPKPRYTAAEKGKAPMRPMRKGQQAQQSLATVTANTNAAAAASTSQSSFAASSGHSVEATLELCKPDVLYFIDGYFDLGHGIDQEWTAHSVDKLDRDRPYRKASCGVRKMTPAQLADYRLLQKLPLKKQIHPADRTVLEAFCSSGMQVFAASLVAGTESVECLTHQQTRRERLFPIVKAGVQAYLDSRNQGPDYTGMSARSITSSVKHDKRQGRKNENRRDDRAAENISKGLLTPAEAREKRDVEANGQDYVPVSRKRAAEVLEEKRAARDNEEGPSSGRAAKRTKKAQKSKTVLTPAQKAMEAARQAGLNEEQIAYMQPCLEVAASSASAPASASSEEAEAGEASALQRGASSQRQAEQDVSSSEGHENANVAAAAAAAADTDDSDCSSYFFPASDDAEEGMILEGTDEGLNTLADLLSAELEKDQTLTDSAVQNERVDLFGDLIEQEDHLHFPHHSI